MNVYPIAACAACGDWITFWMERTDLILLCF